NPPPYTRVLRPCRPGDGIRQISTAEEHWLLARFEGAARDGRIGKMVPASGAASRMFKSLLAYVNGSGGEPEGEVRTLFDNLERFPFYDALAAVMARGGHNLRQAVDGGDYKTVLEYLLTPRGLGYEELPKGLLLFHHYPEGPRTPFEEHLVEAVEQTRSADGRCRLHFTVSPQHEEEFRRLLAEVGPRYEERYGVRFDVTFSYQKRSTDTLAVDPENRPFRQDDGTLLFRPGGHGALLDNLDALGRNGWDIVLIKNIDNVVPEERRPLISQWKRLLTGQLLAVQDRVWRLLERLEEGSTNALDEAAAFLEKELSRSLPAELAGVSEEVRRRRLIDLLDRPLRVCGMVRNLGEPGGGPFWVESKTGEVSIQIVETSQLDPKSEEQQAQLAASTHFSPTDLVCALRDRHGRPYDLHAYVDPSTVFMSTKSHEGRPLKALERPGLWNGSMAGWSSVFVEVPDATFAPVKTVTDLLRPEHQG
ncbi:MAG TPA: DUF4301 family protein, partial [Thermoanaerobaculia bacterium]|nr:DUF4301 family protein [Thermoanaerobaculia bacterium]